MNDYQFWTIYNKYVFNQISIWDKKEIVKVDLHIHSEYSADGIQSVASVFDKAINNNLKIISITDHDSVDAYNEITEILRDNINQKEFPLIIPGVELNVDFPTYNNRCHILRYFFNPFDSLIIDEVKRNGIANWSRAEKQIKRLKLNKALCKCFPNNIVAIEIGDYKKFLLREYKFPLPEYNTMASYLLEKLNNNNISVEFLYHQIKHLNKSDKCYNRKAIKENIIKNFEEKFIKTNNTECSKALLKLIANPSLDDDLFDEFEPDGNISVQKYGQIKIFQLSNTFPTVFAHPNEDGIVAIKKLIKENPLLFDGVEINARNRHCSMNSVLQLANDLHLCYTTGSDNHGEHDYLYNDFCFEIPIENIQRMLRIKNIQEDSL